MSLAMKQHHFKDGLMPQFEDLVKDSRAHIEYDKIVKVFTGKHTNTMYDRHAAILDKLYRIHSQGFPISELVEIVGVIKLAKSKLLEGGDKSILVPSLNRLLTIFGQPFHGTNTLSVQESAKVIVQLIDEHSSLMQLNYFDLNQTVHKNLLILADSVHENAQFDFGEILKDSMAIHQIVAKFDVERNTDIESIEVMLRFLRRVSTSEVFIQKIIDADGLTRLCNLLEHYSNEEVVVSFATEILWNVLDSHAGIRASEILCNETCLGQMKRLFAEYVKNADRPNEKQLRNEMAIVIYLTLTNSGPNYDYFKAVGIFDDVLTFLMPVETGESPNSYPHYLSNSTEDYEFKRILLRFTSTFCNNDSLLHNCIQHGLVQFILLHLRYDSQMYMIKQWSLRQLKGLQLQMVGLLSNIIASEHSLINSGSIGHLLSFLNVAMKYESKDFEKGSNNTSSDIIGLLPEVLRCILRIAEVNIESKKLLGSSNVFDPLFRNQSTEVWYTSLMICSSLCRGCGENKRRFGDSNGVEVAGGFLSFSSPDTNEEDSLLLAATECIWGSVCGSQRNEEEFFQNDGIFKLLDLLEVKKGNLRKHLLSTILDFLENPKTQYHVLEWRRKTTRDRQGIGHFLIELWKQEESILGVPQGLYGQLEKMESPLVGLAQRGVPDRSKYEFGGYVVNEITENLRAKIYSLFCKIGFDHFAHLPLADRVKLELISRYLDFKVGEVWEEISQELYLERIRPVTPDQQCIATSDQVVQIKAQSVRAKQDAVLSQG